MSIVVIAIIFSQKEFNPIFFVIPFIYFLFLSLFLGTSLQQKPPHCVLPKLYFFFLRSKEAVHRILLQSTSPDTMLDLSAKLEGRKNVRSSAYYRQENSCSLSLDFHYIKFQAACSTPPVGSAMPPLHDRKYQEYRCHFGLIPSALPSGGVCHAFSEKQSTL